MKRSNLMLTLVMCVMSISLFAAPVTGDDDIKVLKVLSTEEVNEYSLMNSDFSEISSIQVLENEGEIQIEITGLDSKGELKTVIKKDGFEMLDCGTCILPWKNAPEAQLIIFSNGQSMCVKCGGEDSAPGPL